MGDVRPEVVADIRAVVTDTKLPEGSFITLGGQFQAQEEASRLVGLLSNVSKATARLTLLSGADKREVDLKPVGGKLEAAGNFKVAPGTKALVVVKLAGKPVAPARFTLK